MIKVLVIIFFTMWACSVSAFPPSVMLMCDSTTASSCDQTSEELGDRTVTSTQATIGKAATFCYLATPTCADDLYSANIFHEGTDLAAAKLLIFEDDGDDTIGTADDLVYASASVSSGSSEGLKTTTTWGTTGSAVSTSKDYWVCLSPDSSAANNWSTTYGTGTTGFYCASCDWHDSPPSTLPSTGFSSSVAAIQIFATIGE